MKFFRKFYKVLVAFLMVAMVVPTINVNAANADNAQGLSVEELEASRCGLDEFEVEELGFTDEFVGKKVKIELDENFVEERVEFNTSAYYWRSFTSDYIYKQLSAVEQQIWAAFDEVCIEVATTNENVSQIVLEFTNVYGYDADDLIDILYRYKISHPQYYFLSNRVSYRAGYNAGIALNLYDAFYYGDTRAYYTEYFTAKIDQWVAQINSVALEEEKVKVAHDIVVNNTDYAFNDYDQSAFSLVYLGETVCAGYTATLHMLLNAAGINTISVTSADHAWNEVEIHGQWYAVDTTWDDQYVPMYSYYNKSQATISYDNTSHDIEARWYGLTPALKYDSTLSEYTKYYSPYFTSGNYVYFKINDNPYLSQRYATVVNAYGVTYPAVVSNAGNDYRVVLSNDGNPVKYGLTCGSDGNWYLYYDGAIFYEYTGLVNSEIGWWYVENGVINFNYTGLFCDPNYGWWLIQNGTINFDYTGLYGDANYGWWLIQNGTINFGYNGLFGDAYVGWWLIQNGTINFNYTGLYCDAYVGWWLVQNGTINFGYTGLYGDANYGWWNIENGTINFAYTGLVFDPYIGWWYVQNGTIAFGYTGPVEYNGGYYNVVNGMVVF